MRWKTSYAVSIIAAAIDWKTSDTISVLAAVIALASLVFSFLQYVHAQHNELLRALQGDKESVAYVAYRLGRGKVPRSKRRRIEILTSLVLAAIFTNSDRTRALVHTAARELQSRFPDEVLKIIEEIENDFDRYSDQAGLEKSGRKHLEELKSALEGRKQL
jgi:hypothetical protein